MLEAPVDTADRDANGHDANGHYANGHQAAYHDGNGHPANGLDADGLDVNGHVDISAQLGEDNEALRNLLVETGRKISELEEFRTAFVNVVEPANKALRALEHEKTQNIRLCRALTQTRAGYEALQVTFSDLEKQAATLDSANKQLRKELEKAQDATREIKGSKAELANELAVAGAAVVDLERRLALQTANARASSEDNKHLRDQLVEAESRLGHLDGEIGAAREKLAFTEGDNRSSQKLLDQSLAEASRLAQRLNDSDAALTTARARLVQLEAALAEAETARDRLTIDLKETSERYHADNTKLDRQVEALQSRAGAADRLLVSTRQLLVTRSEEARLADRKAREAIFVQDTAEKKSNEIKAAMKLKESQVEELERARSALHERSTMLAHSLRSCKVQLDEAEDRIRSSAERMAQLEAENNMGRASYERRIEELKATLEEERLERQVVEGALAGTRRHSAELQDEVSKLRVALRRGKPLELAAEPAHSPAEGDRGAHAA